jgi:hypothetical protein
MDRIDVRRETGDKAFAKYALTPLPQPCLPAGARLDWFTVPATFTGASAWTQRDELHCACELCAHPLDSPLSLTPIILALKQPLFSLRRLVLSPCHRYGEII